MLRTRLLLVLIAFAVVASGARATEIAPPAPLSEDIGALDARATLARWLGRAAPTSDDGLVTTSDSAAPGTARALIVGVGGLPALAPPDGFADAVPPLPLMSAQDARDGGGFGIVITHASPAIGAESRGRVLLYDGARDVVGIARFGARPVEHSAVALGGDTLDLITERVVTTPEPGTLALFALGAAGLAIAVARRRRRTGPISAPVRN